MELGGGGCQRGSVGDTVATTHNHSSTGIGGFFSFVIVFVIVLHLLVFFFIAMFLKMKIAN